MPQHPSVEPTTTQVADIIVEARDGLERRREPVTCGIPWPRGGLRNVADLFMRDEQGEAIDLQARCQDRWPDGSVRWVLLDWQASVTSSTRYHIAVACTDEGSPAHGALDDCPTVSATRGPEGGVEVDTGRARFRLGLGLTPTLESALVDGIEVIDPARTGLTVEDDAGNRYRPLSRRLEILETGPLRVAVRIEGELAGEGVRPLGLFGIDLHFFAGSATVRCALTLHNPRKADHPGGLWDLGNGGSIAIRDAAWTLAFPAGSGPVKVRGSLERADSWHQLAADFELYQDSSGGENWKSSNHINRNRVVPTSFRGYRLRGGDTHESGLRATPVVLVESSGRVLSLAMEHFWQNFPKAIDLEGDVLSLRLFPRQYADTHEIQGGEQKTHEFSLAFGTDEVTDVPLDWCRSPLLTRADPQWYCSSGAIPYLTPWNDDPNSTYLSLVEAAIEGTDTFEAKREVIDEYGWRNFGDVYGDHEAVFHKGPTPLVSHYNNQYDNLAGFAYQFLRSGDPRWWEAMDELAHHVIDIDVYHTKHDRSAYNHGLFWHTCHYVDADTGTHRTYPKASRVCGGGPSGGHNYTTGLLLHHFLTGDPLSRTTAIGLARWVIDMDDGRQTIFRWLDHGYHGHATDSGSATNHGPGRAPANSLNALLDGHRLTGDVTFLTKAEQLIRRCIHPDDNIVARNLLDAENKWFYTMFLQALGKYLDFKQELGSLDRMYGYARVSLLRYARWMASHEYPYLDKPEKLEYPTETWAAQDMRKSDVFKFAAKHASGEERSQFLERSDFFFRSSTQTLSSLPTRTLARPVVLMLSNGYMHAYFQRHPEISARPPAEERLDFGRPEVFVPQKLKAIRKAKLLAAAMAGFGTLGLALLAWQWLT